jgi:putative tryptophan/tyrosine transport system substrate-binding protein
MRRRDFVTLLGGAATWPLAARAQQWTMPVIGMLDIRPPEVMSARLRAFRDGLKEIGYVEGDNVAIEYRFAPIDRLADPAAELVRRSVALIVATQGSAVFAAKAATATIPIVFLVGEDPVKLGLVTSLARPSSNLTGVNLLTAELVAKRLEFLRELVPKAARIAVLVNPSDVTTTESKLSDVQVVARTMALEIQVLNANNNPEIDVAFEAIARSKPDALVVASSPFFNGRRVQVVQLAAFHHIPATYSLRDFVEIGGLMSYGPNIGDAYRQIGAYAGQILKGAKPADLPVAQPSVFELFINAQTARMLGLRIPPSLFASADEVIE